MALSDDDASLGSRLFCSFAGCTSRSWRKAPHSRYNDSGCGQVVCFVNRSSAIVIFSVLAACNAVLGLEERPRRDTAAASGGHASGGGGYASCAVACEGDVPEGWSGPTAVRAGGSELACDQGALENLELALHDEASSAPADCACACEDAVGITCDASAVQVTTYDNDDCTGVRDQGSGVLGQCVELCCSGRGANYVKPAPDVSAASCAPTTLVDSKPAPSWGVHLVGCGPVPPTDCGADTCFDSVPESDLCIYRSGEHECPAGPFSERTVGYASFDDSRACEPCGCGPVDTADCNETVRGYAIIDCTVGETLLVPEPGCAPADLDFDGAYIESVAPTGSCTPTGGNPTGEVTPTQPTTVCCVP
jgi:hypothetical protein